MKLIEKYNQTFIFRRFNSTIDEIFNDNYKVIENKILFNKNDIVIDIGANIGAFSILLAKLYPFITIYAVEPVAEAYIQLCENIELNNLTNIIPINVAINGLGFGFKRVQKIIYAPSESGGASSYITQIDDNDPGHKIVYTGCITLDELFIDLHIEGCRLLKIDCEGAEYDILYNSHMSLNRTSYLVGEFHDNDYLRQLGHSPDKLAKYCSNFLKVIYYEYCKMHE